MAIRGIQNGTLSFRKLVVHSLSTDFRAATKIVEERLTGPLPERMCLVRTRYAGVNASDINYSAGKYLPGVDPPLDAGFEGVGTVVATGPGVELCSIGQNVGVMSFGAYSEFMLLPEKYLIPFGTSWSDDDTHAESVPLLVSGLTASLALEEVGEMREGKERVLVTAGAGGTGSIAIQLAKLAGNEVAGTVSTDEKGAFLTEKLGADHFINYKKHSDLSSAILDTFPKGPTLVYECVGGEMFDACIETLAPRGKVIVIGAVSGYKDASAWSKADKPSASLPLPMQLLQKSASVRGFFLFNFLREAPAHMQRLMQLQMEGKLHAVVDPKRFESLDSVCDAVDWMYQGKNVGKIVVEIAPKISTQEIDAWKSSAHKWSGTSPKL